MKKEMNQTMTAPVKILWLVALILLSACRQADADHRAEPGQVKKSVIAGSWYSADRAELSSQVDQFLEYAPKADINGSIYALVVPHAGYVYSGPTAGRAYKQMMAQNFSTVIILGPSHREYLTGISIYPGTGFETPLGVAPIDTELAKRLAASSKQIALSTSGHQSEHSLEIQVPFIQKVLPKAKIIPIAVGDLDWPMCQAIGQALAQAIGEKKVLLVASTDLYHGGSYSECNRMDALTCESIRAFDAQNFFDGWRKDKYPACGGAGVAIVQVAAKAMGATQCEILYRTNSADVTGQRNSDWIVGYTAAIIYKETKTMVEEKVGVELGLNPKDQQTLIRIARETVQQVVSGKKPLKYTIDSEVLKEKRGAFVTLKRGEELRGCIGYILAYKPLYETIIEMAEAAALRDPRFSPVQPEELPELSLEISVLTPIREIKNLDEIEVGTHGLIIEKQGYSGLLLPQVATEYGWDRETFLSHTCLKAGLPRNAWKDKDTKIKIFSAQVFAEDH